MTFDRKTSTRLLYTLFATQSLFSASQIGVITLTTIVATRLSGSESLAGLPSTFTTFSQALLAVPLAVLMGRFGRRVGISLAYALAALGGLVGLLAITEGAFPLMLLSAALLGAGRAGGEQSRFAAGELFPEAERARMIGRIVFAGTVGAVAGPVLAAPSGRLLAALGLNPDMGPWALALALCTLGALITLFLLRPDPMRVAQGLIAAEAADQSDTFSPPARPLVDLLRLPTVQLGILAMLISQTVMVVLMVITPLHMEHQQHGRDSISLVIAAHTLGMFGLSALTGYLIDRFGRVAMLVVGALILVLSAFLAPAAADVTGLAVALFLLGLGWNFGYVAGSSLLADALQGAERARVQGVNDALVFFMAGLGSLSSGPLFASGGYIAINAVGMLMAVILIGLVLRLSRPRPAAEAA